ncbi:MAG: dCMP deaminase family protein [Ruminococcus sp.]|nr:dCMP deaminase family protein [Ruminococcus sp.]
MKRTDYISWDEYFMGIAMFSAERSKDNSTQVGACIVNNENKIVAVGYNGMPTGCSDDEMPWEREAESSLDTKYPFVCHAELNAILNSNSASLNGCTLYVTLFPCNECAKAIIQSGIKRVVYYSNKYKGTDSVTASQFLFDKCGVKTEQYQKSGKDIVLSM